MRYVYLLSTYGEHGAEEVVGTLDREKLPGLIVEHFGITATDLATWTDPLAVLSDLLEQPDAELARERDGYDLEPQVWGGLQLHVVPLS